jgi:hypothetical protein
MAALTTDLEAWRRLFEASLKVQALAPWGWLEEDDIFGVQDAVTGTVGFVSVMGMAGEHFAIALYPDAAALYGFWDLENHPDDITPERLLEIPQLQASYEDREMLNDQERRLIKQLGYKFRGRNAWLQFQSYRPGFAPWTLEGDEIRRLTDALEQTVEVAARAEQDLDILYADGDDDYLVRVPRQTETGVVWEDQVKRVTAPPPVVLNVKRDPALMAQAGKLPRKGLQIELGCLMMPGQIREKGERGYFGYVLLMVERSRGLIIGSDVLAPLPSLQAMREDLPMQVLKRLVALNALPRTLHVADERLYQLLEPMCAELEFRLKLDHRLPMLEGVYQELFSYMRFGGM